MVNVRAHYRANWALFYDGQSSELSGNSKTSRHVLESDSEDENEVDGGSGRERQEIRETTSISKKSAEGSEEMFNSRIPRQIKKFLESVLRVES